ncbi:MAG: UpxY family transcription antiterminator [Bacteroidetes bacterium]|nr:UpxY family transcription antiterminator [Bacteroidota bacterium]MBL7105897.1 UpxY family transcription antiterminator [Bacteroidales bacterium]
MALKEPQKNWYALYTKSRTEKTVFQSLISSGIEAYLPLIKTFKQWSDRKKWVEEPLFRSYIFIYISKKEYFKVLNVSGVVRYITFEGKAVPIPPQQIEAIRQYIGSGEEPISSGQEFQIGDKVEVIRGAMNGLQGQLVRIMGKQKVKIEIEVISQTIFLSISKSFLRIITSP